MDDRNPSRVARAARKMARVAKTWRLRCVEPDVGWPGSRALRPASPPSPERRSSVSCSPAILAAASRWLARRRVGGFSRLVLWRIHTTVAPRIGGMVTGPTWRFEPARTIARRSGDRRFAPQRRSLTDGWPRGGRQQFAGPKARPSIAWGDSPWSQLVRACCPPLLRACSAMASSWGWLAKACCPPRRNGHQRGSRPGGVAVYGVVAAQGRPSTGLLSRRGGRQ